MAYSVEVIGLTQDERDALSNIFTQSKRRAPEFFNHGTNTSLPDIFLVDADDPAAVELFHKRNASGSVPAIMIGDSSGGTHWPLQKRPIQWMKVFKELNLATESPFVTNATMSTDTSADWVLVVDGSFSVREYMRDKLSQRNYNVDYADSGEQAIGLTGQKHYTCVFLEVVLPGVDGYQVCKLIKSNKSAEKTAIIMLTGKTSVFDKVRGVLCGCDAYLAKPVREEILLGIMDKYLPMHALRLLDVDTNKPERWG